MAWCLFDRSAQYSRHYTPFKAASNLAFSGEEPSGMRDKVYVPSSLHEDELTGRHQRLRDRRWYSEVRHGMAPQEPGAAEEERLVSRADVNQEAAEYGNVVRNRLEKMAQQSRFVIDPRTPGAAMWNAVILFNMGLMMIVSPLDNTFGSEGKTAIFVLDESIDGVFLIDTAVQFFLMYESEESNWVFDHYMIVCHYLKTWFLLDLLSVAPWEQLCIILQASGGKSTRMVEALGMLRMCRFLKVLRLARVGRMIQRFQHKFGISYQVMIFCKSMAMMFIMVHWLACVWCWIGRQDPKGDLGESTSLTWIKLVKMVKGGTDEQYDDPVVQYVVSVYWSVMTLTGVGYGDVVPGNTAEFILSVTCVLIAATFWAYVTANLIGVVALVDQHQVRFQTTMDDLNEMMEERNLPLELRQRLRQYFQKCRQFQTNSSYVELLDEMSPGLMGEVSLETGQEWLSKIWWLQSMAQSSAYNPQASGFIREMTKRLASKIFPPREHLVGNAPALYIVQRGLVTRNCRMLGRGAVWGEDIILDEPTLRETETALALTYISVYSMSKLSLAGAMMRYPHAQIQIRKAAIKLAVMRGVQKYAKESLGTRGEVRRPSLLMKAVSTKGGTSQVAKKNVENGLTEFRLWGRTSRPSKKEVQHQQLMAEEQQPELAVKRHMDELLTMVDDKMRLFDHRIAGIEGMMRMQKHQVRF